MNHKDLNVIILAAGNNTRMLSNIPKTMHQIAGKSMLQHLIDTIVKIDVQSIYIVYNSKKEKFFNIDYPSNSKISIHWIQQNNPKGTGDAVQQVLKKIHNNNSEILILYGDVPLVSPNTLERLRYNKSQCDISLLTGQVQYPTGYGRIIRNNLDQVIKIIEDTDIINEQHRKIKEINSGIFIAQSGQLKNWLEQLTLNHNNKKKELYLTNIINIAYQNNYCIRAIYPSDTLEIIGINNKYDLINVERQYQKKQAENLLKLGITISDPNRFDLRGSLKFGTDVYIDVNVIIKGNVLLGNRIKIGANCILKNVEISDDVIIHPFSCIENSKIGYKSTIGPFARLRPETQIQEQTKIGNFVELKNVKIGKKSKVKHLSYLGDAEIGKQVNIGAGTIICNYDGKNKNYTHIEDNVFVGSNSQLIAPIEIKKNAIIGAGTTVTHNVPEGEIILSRVKQFSILNKIKKHK